MPASVNNLFIQSLRTGEAASVATLFQLGHGPHVLLDWVEESRADVLGGRTEPTVSSRSIWFWVHQAPKADAVAHCWQAWLERELASVSPRLRSEKLQVLLEQAVDAALSTGSPAGLLVSWEASLAYAGQPDERWTRQSMLNILKHKLPMYGNDSAAVLLALHDRGHLIRPDVERWAAEEGGPLHQAQARGFAGLQGLLLDIISEPHPECLKRLGDHLDSTIAAGANAGPGVWENENMGARWLACYQGLVDRGLPPSRPLPEPLVEAVGRTENWPESSIAALRQMVLDRRIASSAPTPRRSRSRI